MSGLFGKPPEPKVSIAPKQPDSEDPAVIEAKKRRLATELARDGRQNTILSTSNVGGGRSTLGGS
jgi:hypothetical protein